MTLGKSEVERWEHIFNPHDFIEDARGVLCEKNLW